MMMMMMMMIVLQAVLTVLIGWLVRWEVSGGTTAVFSVPLSEFVQNNKQNPFVVPTNLFFYQDVS